MLLALSKPANANCGRYLLFLYLLLANRTNSRIQESRENYYYNSATNEK